MYSEVFSNTVRPISTVLLTSEISSTDTLSTTIQSIADQGVTIIIAAIVILFLGNYLNNVLKRENDVLYGILPKLEEINKSIKQLQTTFNEVIGAHNARSNQSLKTIERTTSDIKGDISEEAEMLREISNRITVLESNYNTLFKLFLSFMGNKPSLTGNDYYDEINFIESNDDDENWFR